MELGHVPLPGQRIEIVSHRHEIRFGGKLVGRMAPVSLGENTELQIDAAARTIKIGDRIFKEGDVLTLDGNGGSLYAGAAQTEMEYPVELLRRLESLGH
jgi:hypothetical protein